MSCSGSASPGCVSSAGCPLQTQSMNWTWNSSLLNGWSKLTLEGLLGDSSLLNSSCQGEQSRSLPSLLLECALSYPSTAAPDGLDDLGGLSKPTCTASERLEMFKHGENMSPGLGLWMPQCSVGFLNPSTLNQPLHWLNVCGLISSFPKQSLWRAKLPKQWGLFDFSISF